MQTMVDYWLLKRIGTLLGISRHCGGETCVSQPESIDGISLRSRAMIKVWEKPETN